MADVNRDNTSMRGGTSKACHTVRQGFKYELFEKQAPFSFPETSRRYLFVTGQITRTQNIYVALYFYLRFSVFVSTLPCAACEKQRLPN